MEELEQTATADSEVADNPQIVEQQVTDTPTDEPSQVESDEEDYELGDDKYRVPKTLKAHIDELKAGNLRNEDYTQKNQSVAEQRRALEAERQEFVQRQQFQQQHLDKVAEVKALDRQLEQYQKLDWNAITDADPVQAMKLERQMRELQTQREGTVRELNETVAKATTEQQQATARQLMAAREQLAREIKGFGTPEVTKALTETGKAFGFKPEELANVNDPRAIKLLHEAYLYRKLVADKQKETKLDVKPITRIGGAAATAQKNPSDMTDKEFSAWRKRQIAQR
jgi:hypothetical protein